MPNCGIAYAKKKKAPMRDEARAATPTLAVGNAPEEEELVEAAEVEAGEDDVALDEVPALDEVALDDVPAEDEGEVVVPAAAPVEEAPVAAELPASVVAPLAETVALSPTQVVEAPACTVTGLE